MRKSAELDRAATSPLTAAATIGTCSEPFFFIPALGWSACIVPPGMTQCAAEMPAGPRLRTCRRAPRGVLQAQMVPTVDGKDFDELRLDSRRFLQREVQRNVSQAHYTRGMLSGAR